MAAAIVQKKGGHGGVERVAHVGVVGDGAHQRHTASGLCGFTPWAMRRARVNQHAGGNAFVQPVPLEVAGALGNRHQLARHCRL